MNIPKLLISRFLILDYTILMFTLFIVQRSSAGYMQAARFSMNSDEVADEVEYLQCRVTADMIKSYCGRGSQSLRGNSLP